MTLNYHRFHPSSLSRSPDLIMTCKCDFKGLGSHWSTNLILQNSYIARDNIHNFLLIIESPRSDNKSSSNYNWLQVYQLL